MVKISKLGINGEGSEAGRSNGGVTGESRSSRETDEYD